MKTAIAEKVLTFNQLGRVAKQNAINNWREGDHEFFHDFILDEWQEKLTALGYSDIKILYSGFWSQGDGACFTGTLDIEKFLRRKKKLKFYKAILKNYYCRIKISHAAHYYYSTSTSVDIEFSNDNDRADFRKIIEDKLENLLIDFLEKEIAAERETGERI